uniref:Granulins domain-containing protein n=1 Tax=Strigamia maritima TaxID=126957 RepID=T1IV61_STRMM
MDHAHCCPERSVCDLKRQRCIPEMLLERKAAKSHTSLTELTPVHKEFDKLMYLIYNRYDNSKSQNQGCSGCPLEDAVCCSDGIHCCPQHMNCGTTTGTCVEKEDLTNAVLITEVAAEVRIVDNSLPWTDIRTKLADQVCPGGKMKCGDNDTCCKLQTTGSYVCCPLPKATCCSDGLHCCPNGMQCDLVHMRCAGSENREQLYKTNDICPDHKTRCPDGTTCCQLDSGYGCCPYPKAVCCTDKAHCCPNGYKCDVVKTQCVKGDVSFDAPQILQGEKITVRSVVCPGGHFKCPDNTTCCQLPDGRYGCCPYPHAVCCTDKQHCCPESTKCDLPHQRCIQQWFTIPFARVLYAEKIDRAP